MTPCLHAVESGLPCTDSMQPHLKPEFPCSNLARRRQH